MPGVGSLRGRPPTARTIRSPSNRRQSASASVRYFDLLAPVVGVRYPDEDSAGQAPTGISVMSSEQLSDRNDLWPSAASTTSGCALGAPPCWSSRSHFACHGLILQTQSEAVTAPAPRVGRLLARAGTLRPSHPLPSCWRSMPPHARRVPRLSAHRRSSAIASRGGSSDAWMTCRYVAEPRRVRLRQLMARPARPAPSAKSEAHPPGSQRLG